MELKKLAIAGALILMSGTAFAGQGHACNNGHFDKAKWQEHKQEFFQQRQERLHTVLQLTTAQEGAWKSYQDQIKPQAKTEQPDHKAFAKLTTLERLDKMEAWDKARDARAAQRSKAIRTFYAQLNDAQKKVFDENAFPHRGHRGHGNQHHK